MRTRSFILTVLLAACGVPGSGTSPPSGSGLGSCTKLDPSTWSYMACAGSFEGGKALTLCPVGYELAATSMPAALATACDQNYVWNTADYFFAVDAGVWANPAAPFGAGQDTSCAAQDGWVTGLMGCGGKQHQASAGSTAFSAMLGQPCQGWPHARLCQIGPDWTCPDGTLSTASNSNPRSGVICYNPSLF